MRVRDENKISVIKQQALEMIVAEGFDGFSMQKLAKKAGVSPGTLYIYFRDKNDLILSLCREVNHKMAEATLKNFDPYAHFADGLRIQWMNRVKYCLSNPLNMHFMEQIKFSPYHVEAQKTMDPKFHVAMRTFVHNAFKRNELVKLQVEVYWSVAFAPLYALVKFHMSGRGLSGNEKFALTKSMMNQTIELVVKALTPVQAIKKNAKKSKSLHL